MSTDCERIRGIIFAFLGKATAGKSVTPDDLELAYRHVQRCALCQKAFSPKERWLFIHGVVLERE